MKICFITTIFPTLKAFVLNTAEYIHTHTDWDISFICSPDDELEDILPEYIHYFPVPMKRGISLSGIKAMLEMYQIFKAEKFDLIQYSTPNAALYASIAGHLAKIRVRNYHLMGFRYLGAKGISKLTLKQMERITCKNSTHIECVSKSNLAIGVKEKIFKPEKAVIIWNGSSGGVELNRFDYRKRAEYRAQIRGKYSLSEQDFVYGFVGRITKDKGIDELLDAFSHIENAKLLMVGDAENTDSLNQQLYSQSQKEPNIIYTGLVRDVEKYFSAMDVLVLPSYREGFGNVVIEAGAMGTPAIVSRIPGPVDAIDDGRTALCVEVKNSSDLLAKMQKIRAMDYVAMGYNAVLYIREKFDSTVLCQKILERKKELLENAPL